MTMVEICMCVIISFMFSGIIMMGILIGKLSDIACMVDIIKSDTAAMERRVDATRWIVDDIKDYVDCIREEVCTGEDDSCGLKAEVGVCDELVKDTDEDELDIHLITPEDYHFANGYSKNELTYSPNTDQVKYFFDDDTCLSMEDIPEYIGDGLLFFGMNIQEPNVVYVRNHVLNADFRIEKFEVHCDA